MNDSKNSNGWLWFVIAVLIAICIGLGYGYKAKSDELIEHDSVSYHVSLQIQKQNSILHEKSDSLHKAQGLLRKDVLSWVERTTNAWDKTEKKYKDEIANLKRLNHAPVPELDSLQFALYGAPPNDSTHTIPLDYSRKLTGDALRLPIEQRMATLATSMVDSLKSHYGRLVDSYKVDIALFKQDAEADHDAITGLMKNAGEMQAVIDKKDRAFRRQRRKERIIEGLIIVGIIASL